MKIKIYIYLFLIFKIGHSQPIQKLNMYDSIFFNLKCLEFKKAQNKLHTFKRNNNSILLNNIAEVLYNGGQKKIDINLSNYSSFKSKFEKSLFLLLSGYQELYNNPLQSKAFEYFSKGYALSEEIGYIPLQKQYLLGILELYHWEILETNKLYTHYLKELLILSKDPVDHFWQELYNTILSSKTIYDITNLSSKNLCHLNDRIVDELLNKSNLMTKYYYEKGIFFGFDKNYEKSKYYYNKILNNTKKHPFLRYITFGSHLRLSIISAEENNFKKALIQLDSAKKYIDKVSPLRSLIHIHKSASLYHTKLNQFEYAYEELQNSIEAEHKLKYSENSIEISRLNIKYQTAEKEKQLLIEQQKKKRNQNIAIGLGGSLFLGIIIVFLIYRNTKRKQRIAEQEREIEIQKTEKLLKEQELNAIDAMISGQEKERQRLANDLHDNLGSTLATVKLHFDHLKKNRNNPKLENIEELYTKTNNLLDEAYHKVRNIAHEKNSGVMANQGLLQAIKTLAKKVSTNNNLQVEIQGYGLNERLDNTLEISIFRMIQELITNTIKHAEASDISISLTNHESLLNIIIEDNGKGFDAKILPEKEGMGLKSIEKRIEQLEGTFEVDSTIGKGTHIIINIPI